MNNARTPQFYMANLGSEVVGMYSALSKNDTEKCRKCYDRAKNIIAEWRVLETRESARAEMKKLEEVVDDLISETPQLKVSKVEIESYFLPFALRALSV